MFQEDMSVFFNTDEFASDATFIPQSSFAVATKAILDHNLELTDPYGTIVEVELAITLPRADVALPRKGDQIVIGAETYRIGRVVRYDEYMVTVSCSFA